MAFATTRRTAVGPFDHDAGVEIHKLVHQNRLRALGASYRCQGATIAFTNGCFDLLHAGHIRCLEDAARLGTVLVVAANSDASIRRLKGAARPIIKQAERLQLLAALECVDHVLLFDDDSPRELIRRLRPDVLAKGGTYRPGQIAGREIVLSYGGRVCVTGRAVGISTTEILARMRAALFEEGCDGQ